MLTAHYNLPRQQYNTQAAIDSFNLLLRNKLEQLPGVQAAGVTTLLPVSGQDVRSTFTPEGYIPVKGAGLNLVWESEVMATTSAPQPFPSFEGATLPRLMTVRTLRLWSSSIELWRSTTGQGRTPSANACTVDRRRQRRYRG
jgi:hypothetical protein